MSSPAGTNAPGGPSDPPGDDLIFRLDELRCGLDATAVLEVLPALAVHPLPGQPLFVAGSIDVRGTLIPVLDLRVRFGRPHRAMQLSDRLILARVHDRTLAVWVDAVEGLVAHDGRTVTATGGLLVGDRSLVGVATTADGLCSIHDLDGFISACESDALALAVAS
jgi:purine-binding chemotaxis protein CheW